MTKVPQSIINRFLGWIDSADSDEELDRVFKTFVSFSQISNFSLVKFLDIFSKDSFVELFSTYPQRWRDHYRDMNYHAHDPIFNHLGHVQLPFLWNKNTFSPLTPIQKQLFKEAETFGLTYGLAIPLGVSSGAQSFVLIPNQKRLYVEQNYIISLICQAYEHKKNTLSAKSVCPILSPREIEILRLRYNGIMIKQICHELEISKSTVSFHLNNAKKKLDAKNLNEALIRFWQIEHTF